jgi:hypothetical protein
MVSNGFRVVCLVLSVTAKTLEPLLLLAVMETFVRMPRNIAGRSKDIMQKS